MDESTYDPYFQRVRPSQKFIDTSGSTQPLASAVTWLTPLLLTSGLIRGTSASSRIGNVIRYLYLMIDWSYTEVATATGEVFLRTVIIYDKQPNGVQPTALDVFSADAYNAFFNVANEDRFIILHDKRSPYLENGVFTGWQQQKTYDLCELKAIYNNNNTGTITDYQTGAISMWYATSGGGAVQSPQFTFRTRICYDDL